MAHSMPACLQVNTQHAAMRPMACVSLLIRYNRTSLLFETYGSRLLWLVYPTRLPAGSDHLNLAQWSWVRARRVVLLRVTVATLLLQIARILVHVQFAWPNIFPQNASIIFRTRPSHSVDDPAGPLLMRVEPSGQVFQAWVSDLVTVEILRRQLIHSNESR